MRRALLVLALASAAVAQILEGVIELPDSLGGSWGPYHLALGTSTSQPRLFIGAEGGLDRLAGDVIVPDAGSLARVVRIPAGNVYALCYNVARNKLYCVDTDSSLITVVDCETYRIVDSVRVGRWPRILFWNPANDRVYSIDWADSTVSVIDCATDSVIATIAVGYRPAHYAFDSAANRLYIGGRNAVVTIDCNVSQVVAQQPVFWGAKALCFNPAGNKLYVVAGTGSPDSLLVLRATGDSVVARLGTGTLAATLTCNPAMNEVYCCEGGDLVVLDGAGDSIVGRVRVGDGAVGLLCDPARGKAYVALGAMAGGAVAVVDVRNRQVLTLLGYNVAPQGLHLNPRLGRVFVETEGQFVNAICSEGDTFAGLIPMTVEAFDLCLNTVDNRAYLSPSYYWPSSLSVIDLTQYRVTRRIPMPSGAFALTFSSASDRLYFRSVGGVSVFDCHDETLVGFIPAPRGLEKPVWLPTPNKLYFILYDDYGIGVIDCNEDSFMKTIPLSGWGTQLYPVSEINRLVVVCGTSGLSFIDCTRDSVVAETMPGWTNIWDISYSLPDTLIYCNLFRVVRAVNLLDPSQSDSICSSGDLYGWHILCAPNAHKVYWAVEPYEPDADSDTMLVIDGRSRRIIARLGTFDYTGGMCLDATGNYVYVAGQGLAVIDTRLDSVVARVHDGRYLEAPMLVPVRRRLYVTDVPSQRIWVYRDSVVSAVSDGARQPRRAGPPVQTVFRGKVRLAVQTPASLIDIAGRKEADLMPGEAVLLHLAPGVYFIKPHPEGASGKVLVLR